jgi:CHAT domain-containing protein
MSKLANWLLPLLLISSTVTVATQPLIAVSAEARSTQAAELLKEVNRLLEQSQFLVAQQAADRLARLYRELGEAKGQQQALILLGTAFYRQGDYQQAAQVLRQAENLSADTQQRGHLQTLQGLIALEMGNYRQAVQTFKFAQGSQISNLTAETQNRIGLGEAYRYLGLYRQAQDVLGLALRTSGDRRNYGSALNALGDVHFDLGQSAEAQDYYQQALSVRRGVGDQRAILRTLNNLGRVQRELENLPAALKLHQEALNIAIGLGDQNVQVSIFNNLGLIQTRLGQLDPARASLERAVAINRLGNSTLDVATLINFARYYVKAGQPQRALEAYQEAIRWAQHKGDRLGEAKALSGLGELRLKSGDAPAAIQTLQNSIELFEALRPGLRDEEKVALFESQAQTYRLLQKAWITKGDPAAALVAAERGRARTFVELLAKRLTPATEAELTLKPQSFASIQATAKQHRATLVSYSILQADQQDAELYIWVVTPAGKLTFRAVDLQALKQTSGTTLDTIAQGSRVAAATGIEKSRQLVTNLVVAMRGTLTDRAPSGLLASTRNAYEVLIQPIADLLPSDPNARVIFIPQDALLLVPFQALQDSTGKFLIEKHTLLTAPSIQALSLIKKYQPSPTATDLVIGNPSPMPEPLGPLPGAEAEAKAIAKILNTQALTGNQAKEITVLQKISQARIIHLATHGLLDDQQGLQSSLAFAPSSGNTGLLTAAEILTLKLKADLAVLSACDTGRGKITGDGVIGLSRSLLSAGVSSVVVSLWSVPDEPTALLMTEFYRNLRTNPDKAQALRKAMLATMAQHPNPRDWAGFVLIGSAD